MQISSVPRDAGFPGASHGRSYGTLGCYAGWVGGWVGDDNIHWNLQTWSTHAT